jgi:hypothetical protein
MPFKTTPPNYSIWQGMLRRCDNHRIKAFKDYGGRGIKVCDRWKDSFQNFIEDMGERPHGASIDRIDNDGDYAPENCRWATRKEQQRNRRDNVYVTIESVRYLLAELAEKFPYLKRDTIQARAEAGMSMADVIKPGRHKRFDTPHAAIASRKAKSAARTHCPNGHEFSDANTYIRMDGSRICRICRNERLKNARHR